MQNLLKKRHIGSPIPPNGNRLKFFKKHNVFVINSWKILRYYSIFIIFVAQTLGCDSPIN